MTIDNEPDRVFADVKRFLTHYKGLLQAAEKWEGIASLQRAEEEAHAKVRELKQEVEHLTANRDKILADMRAEVETSMAADKAFYKEHVEHLLKTLDAVKQFSRRVSR
jgi:hypothetical protein